MSPIQCPQCHAVLLGGLFNLPDPAPCPSCAAPLKVEVFPALFRPPPASTSPQPILLEGESSCFYHAQKKAVVPCDGCGRFLCSLCDLEIRGDHLCPACLESGTRKGKLSHLIEKRFVYGQQAFYLALIPLIVWPLTALTAPISLFITVRYWNAPSSLVRSQKLYFLAAILIALLQISGWILLLHFLWMRQ